MSAPLETPLRSLAERSAVAIPWRVSSWFVTILVAATLLGLAPLAIATCCAPPAATGFGTAWFVNDFAQYESAIRQGAEQSGWLVYDQFTIEPHAPALMFSLYVFIGKLSALTHVPWEWLERTLEVVSRMLLVWAVWRFCHAFASDRNAARVAVLLTLFGSGFEMIAAAAGLNYTGNWSYESNTIGLLFAAPHVPLGMAATLELMGAWLKPVRQPALLAILTAAVLGAAIAVLHPFHEPVVLAALLLVGIVFWRSQQAMGTLAAGIAASLGALPVLWPTVQTFSFDPFWSAAYSVQNRLSSPIPHELLIDLGPTLVLALAGAFAFRGRVAPFGVLIWLLLGAIAMYLPVPYQRRLSFGLQPALAVVAANALVAFCLATTPGRAAWLRRIVFVASANVTALILATIASSGLTNEPLPVYRSTTDLDAAARWLDARAVGGEVILADWNVSNYLAPRTHARVIGGHPVATLNAADKQARIATVFAHTASREVARQYGAQWLVYGPDEANLAGPPDPAFQSGSVRVYRVGDG